MDDPQRPRIPLFHLYRRAHQVMPLNGDILQIEKKDDAWQIVKPAAQPADERKVKELLDLVSGLRAEP